MASIRPFRALRYDLPTAGDPADLLAPPYDVVDAEGRAALAGRSPNNCVHVILPEAREEGGDRYDAGREAFVRMLDQGTLRMDARPGYYVYHQRFEAEGRSWVRKGFVANIELTRFGHGPVKPHERTLSGPKEDRLRLMRACKAHLELVFGLFPDPEKAWEAAVEGALGEPVLRCEFDGSEHTLYRVEDPAACARLGEVLANKDIYIADGHHRYETMCAFADELAGEAEGPEAASAAAHGMIYLSNLDDEGLVVLPTHRRVYGLPSVDLGALRDQLARHFEIEDRPLPGDPSTLRALLAAAAQGGPALALAVPGQGQLTLLRLRADFDPAEAGLAELHPSLARLDVVLLHELVIERGLGISKEAQADKRNLEYDKSTAHALEVARAGDGGKTQLVCLMNATPVRDVVAVCDSGQVMPQKSTFFHPKIPTGLCFHDIAAAMGGRRG